MQLKQAYRPNFFILGAAKCGTTSLWHHLSQHPDIHMAEWKEPALFCDSYNAVRNVLDYTDIFENAGNSKIRGEASVAYITTPRAPAALQAFCPDAKFVIILRHPADRAYSLYHHMRYRGHEFAPTFELALRLENRRMGSRRFWNHSTHYPFNFLYFTSGLFDQQIDRYFDYFPRDRFHFLTLSRLKANPDSEIRAIFSFLEVDDTFQPGAEKQNVGGKTARHPLLKHLLVQRIPRLLKHQPPSVAIPEAGRRWIDWDTKAVPPILESTRSRLCERYAESVLRLPELTGLEVSIDAF